MRLRGDVRVSRVRMSRMLFTHFLHRLTSQHGGRELFHIAFSVALLMALIGLVGGPVSAVAAPSASTVSSEASHMAIPGQYEVSASGAFGYSIPIVVPRGTAGMAPVLSLDYSSSGGDGTVGLGWSVNGIPQITRCPRTLAQDGVHGSVNYDVNDRFCIGGKRLVAVVGAYGADGTEYRTEVDDFSKVISHGTSGVGPAWFEVHTKSNQTIYYGYDEDTDNSGNSSRITLSPSNVTARAWGAEKILDNKGNYLIVKYTNDMTNGQAYPVEIDYTGNHAAALTPFASVKFVYSTRTDIIPTYQAGYLQQTTVLLANIETFLGSAMVANYKLAYNAASSGASHDELKSVTLCDSGANCLPPTTFTWQGTRDNPPFNSVTPPSMVLTPAIGDFNSDGLIDYVTFSTDPACSSVGALYHGIYLGTAAGTYVPSGMTIGSSAPACFQALGGLLDYPKVMDLNGDGFADLYARPSSGFLTFLLNSKSGQFTAVTPVTPPGTLAPLFGDFSGDGRTDQYFYNAGSNPGTGFFEFSNGDGTFSMGPSNSWPGAKYPIQVGDFDGDGCADLSEINSANPNPILYSCHPAVVQSTLPSCSVSPVFGDFNGDGKTDVICEAPIDTVYLSTGTGFVSAGAPPSNPSSFPIVTGDWNGDGKTDLLIGSTLYLSTGTGFKNLGTISSSSSGAYAADWNNDGASDLWVVDLSTPTSLAAYDFAYVPELMTSVNNGIGITTTATYDRINKNGSFYTKGTAAAYPTEDVDSPLYVVSEIATSNGVGGNYNLTYAYAGAQSDLHGRGFLGFSRLVMTDVQTGVVQATTYRTDFPFSSLIASQVRSAPKTGGGAVTISSTVNDYEQLGLGTGTDGVPRYFVGLHQSVLSSNDENFVTGVTYDMPTVTTTYTFDCDSGSACAGSSPTGFGNVVQEVESIASGAATSTKTTTNTYFGADTTRWFIAELKTADIQRVVGSSNITRHTSYAYDLTSGLLTAEITEPSLAITDPLRTETDYGYDAYGNRNSIAVKACVWIGSTCTQQTRTTTASFDVPAYHGAYPTELCNALGHCTNWTYDLRFGVPLSRIDANNIKTSWSYDTFGRRTLQALYDSTAALIVKTVYDYTYCTGLPSGESCPANAQFDIIATPESASGSQNGPVSVGYRDGLLRTLASDTQGFAGPTNWIRAASQYDANGNLLQTSRPYFLSGGTAKYTFYAYDPLGRVTKTTRPDASYTAIAYEGFVRAVTEHVLKPGGTNLDEITTTIRNKEGYIASVQDAANKTTSYIYDAFGDLLTVTDPSANVTTDTYDIRGRKLTSSDPDMGSWSYVYDGYSELYKQTDAKGQVTTLAYDVNGDILQRVESGLVSNWVYGASAGSHNVDKLVSACTGSGCTTPSNSTYFRALTYDTLSRPSTTALTIGDATYTYTDGYDANARLASVTYPSGLVAKYWYTSLGYLCRITDDLGSPTCSNAGGASVFWTANTMDAEMHLLTQTAGSSVVTTQSFDPNTGTLLSILAGASNSVANFAYTYDSIGNPYTRNNGVGSVAEGFTYDTLNRLTQYTVQSPAQPLLTRTGVYDALGNITEKTNVCATANCFAYGAGTAGPHALTSITGTYNGVTNPTFTYDLNGNMTAGAGRTISYTAFNMVASILEGTLGDCFTYDSEHARVEMDMHTGSCTGALINTTYYLNDPTSGAMSEKLVTSGVTSWHDYLLAYGRVVAERISGGAPVGTPANWGSTNWGAFQWSGSPAPTWLYFVQDNLGSISVITDASGVVVNRLSYDAWGRRRNSNGSDSSNCIVTTLTTRGFTSQEMLDDGFCLINMNARIYEPSLGRFLSADSIVSDVLNGQSLNRYSYVNNAPLSATDPTGNVGCGTIDGIEACPAFGDRIKDDFAVVALISSGINPYFSLSVPGFSGSIGATVQAPSAPTPGQPANGKTKTEQNLDLAAQLQSDVGGNANPKEGDTRINADGVTITFHDGNWQPLPVETVDVDAQNPDGPCAACKPNGTIDTNGGDCAGCYRTAQEAMALCALGPEGCATGAAITAGQAIVSGTIIVGGTAVLQNKIPKDAKDPNGAKAPGKPGAAEGFRDPKSGEKWNGSGWVDSKGNVWVPTGKAGAPGTGTTGPAHGGPHWDVQKPGGGYVNVRPGQHINDVNQ